MIKTKKQMFVVIGAFVLVMLLGTITYAFFNYTRTGAENRISTGRIYFNADQGNNTVTLSDLFPISLGQNETVTSSTPGVGSLKLHIEGDTSYTEGVEYLIEAVDVEGNGQTALPISIDISYAATEVASGEDPNVIGTNDEDYFTNRGGNTSRYKLLSNGSISEGEDILVGYIAPGNTGIDGELTILAYLDAANIAITDTYPEGTKLEIVTNYSTSACETALAGAENVTPATVCADGEDLQAAIDNSDLTTAQINALLSAGVITEYTDGTTSEWVSGRTVFTTEEWNALQATGVSFKIKATAQEGTWVSEPIILAADVVMSAGGVKNVAGAYRYTGLNVDNYAYFNCVDDDDVSTCEIWRIIGLYGNNLKIIRENGLGFQSFDSSSNVWETSNLKNSLNLETNGGYYYSLQQSAKDKIVSGTWLTGPIESSYDAYNAYVNAQLSEVLAKVGLISVYEYLYAGESSCYETAGSSYNLCKDNNWIYNVINGGLWTISPDLSGSTTAFLIPTNGYVYAGHISYTVDVYPTVYLNSNVTIKGGTGESTNPYRLG